MFPVRCNGDTFKKKFFEKNIAAFQLVGYSAWNGEDVSSGLACYTEWPVRLMVQDTTQNLCGDTGSPDVQRDRQVTKGSLV